MRLSRGEAARLTSLFFVGSILMLILGSLNLARLYIVGSGISVTTFSLIVREVSSKMEQQVELTGRLEEDVNLFTRMANDNVEVFQNQYYSALQIFLKDWTGTVLFEIVGHNNTLLLTLYLVDSKYVVLSPDRSYKPNLKIILSDDGWYKLINLGIECSDSQPLKVRSMLLTAEMILKGQLKVEEDG